MTPAQHGSLLLRHIVPNANILFPNDKARADKRNKTFLYVCSSLKTQQLQLPLGEPLNRQRNPGIGHCMQFVTLCKMESLT